MLSGKRIAILGLGRSGLAVARAAIAHGAIPTVYDRSTREQILKPDVLTEAEGEGIEVVLGWTGSFQLVGDPALAGNGRDARATDILVVNPAVDKRSPILKQAVDQGIEVIGEPEFAFRIAKAPIVAITGTNGKTTTTVMTYLALQACGENPILCGNIFGSDYPEMTLTEAAMCAREDQVLVAEISSFQLEWVKDFAPVVAGITNIGTDHLDRYDNADDYAETKKRILDRATWQVLSTDWDAAPHRLRFGPGGDAEVTEDVLRILDRSLSRSAFQLVGDHYFTNAAMAGLLASAYLAWRECGPAQTCPAKVLDVLSKFKGVKHRMEAVGTRDGIEIINNSMCTNPAAVLASVTSVHAPRKHVLLGGVNKNLDFAPLAPLFEDSANKAYLFGRDREEIARKLNRSFPQFETMQEAFAAAAQEAQPGEVIMLSPGCASSDQFEDFRHRGDVFKQIAKEWLDR